MAKGPNGLFKRQRFSTFRKKLIRQAWPDASGSFSVYHNSQDFGGRVDRFWNFPTGRDSPVRIVRNVAHRLSYLGCDTTGLWRNWQTR